MAKVAANASVSLITPKLIAGQVSSAFSTEFRHFALQFQVLQLLLGNLP
jgi:hypothetical protein